MRPHPPVRSADVMAQAGIGVRIGSVVVTPEGLLLACAMCVFLLASYGRVRDATGWSGAAAGVTLAWVSLCGVAGAAVYGIPGTLAAAQQPDGLPFAAGVAFGSFGGYWGVLLGGLAAAWARGAAPLPLLDALAPGILLGGLVARAAVLFATDSPLSLSPFALWSIADMAAHAALFAGVLTAERRSFRHGFPLIAFLAGYGVLRFALEFFREDAILWAGFTWGHHMSVAQTIVGCILFAAIMRRGGRGRADYASFRQ